MRKYKSSIILISGIMLFVIFCSILMQSSIAGVIGKYFETFNFSITLAPKTYTITFIDQNQPIKVQYTDENGVSEEWDGIVEVTVGTYIDLSKLVLVDNDRQGFSGWENAGGTQMVEIPETHETDIVLYPIWEDEYWIRFMDGLGNGAENVLLAYSFVKGNKPTDLNESDLNAALQTVQDRYDAQYDEGAYIITGWDKDYNNQDIYNVDSDIVVTAVGVPQEYNGILTFTPIDYEPADGIPDAYETSGLTAQDLYEIIIPGYYNGKPVINLGNDTFSGFDDLHTTTLPKTIKNLGDFVFAGEHSNWKDGETMTFYYEGSYQEWCDNISYSELSFAGLSKNTYIFFLNGGEKVDLDQGYLQVTQVTWVKTGGGNVFQTGYYETTLTHSGDLSDDAKQDLIDKYDSTCTCSDCGGADRPDRQYWTDVVIE